MKMTTRKVRRRRRTVRRKAFDAKSRFVCAVAHQIHTQSKYSSVRIHTCTPKHKYSQLLCWSQMSYCSDTCIVLLRNCSRRTTKKGGGGRRKSTERSKQIRWAGGGRRRRFLDHPAETDEGRGLKWSLFGLGLLVLFRLWLGSAL